VATVRREGFFGGTFRRPRGNAATARRYARAHISAVDAGRRRDGARLEGVEQEDAVAAFNDIIQNPQSDHERYIGSHVVPNLHGVDPSAGPPPPMEKLGVSET
jgi:hypothetical protein